MAGDAARILPTDLVAPSAPVLVPPAGSGEGTFGDVLTAPALGFLADLHRRFDAERRALLATRRRRQSLFDAGELPDFRPDTRAIRDGDWTVAPIPAALQDR